MKTLKLLGLCCCHCWRKWYSVRYKCNSSDYRVPIFGDISSSHLTVCDSCSKSKDPRVYLSSVSFHLKWYIFFSHLKFTVKVLKSNSWLRCFHEKRKTEKKKEKGHVLSLTLCCGISKSIQFCGCPSLDQTLALGVRGHKNYFFPCSGTGVCFTRAL